MTTPTPTPPTYSVPVIRADPIRLSALRAAVDAGKVAK